jgi:hypothetical protein
MREVTDPAAEKRAYVLERTQHIKIQPRLWRVRYINPHRAVLTGTGTDCDVKDLKTCAMACVSLFRLFPCWILRPWVILLVCDPCFSVTLSLPWCTFFTR